MRKILLALVFVLAPVVALANGYADYPSAIAWSPDSRHIALANPDHNVLQLFDRDGVSVSELVYSTVTSPAFSPDGQQLLVSSNSQVTVFPAPFDGAGMRVLQHQGPALDCTWQYPAKANEKAQILFSAGERFYGADVWRASSDLGSFSKLTDAGPRDSALMPLSWPGSPNIYYLRQAGAGEYAYERLYVLDTATGSSRQLTVPQSGYPDDYHESNMLYLNKDELLFQRGGWGDWKLVRINVNTGLETVELSDAESPSVDAAGRWLAFLRRPAAHKAEAEYDWDIVPQLWLMDRSTGRQWRLETSIAGANFPSISPDGTRLAWVQFDEGTLQLEVRDIAQLTAVEPTVMAAPTMAAGNSGSSSNKSSEEDCMEQFDVVLETTKGDIVLRVHPEWAPIGAAHFRELVEAGFYDGAPMFRVIPGFVAQWGIAADPALNDTWGEKNIKDEPVVQGNLPGMVTYGMSGQPNSRTTHVYINYADNRRLDAMGFAAFAEVVEGMDVALSLQAAEYDDQGGLAAPGGMDAFKRRFPNADYITTARVRE
jgi:peptidyl-prolyl cis-trans isomerase A (cyclophilin A)